MNILPIIQVVSAIITPLVVLLLAWQINRRLEQSKLSFSKEKEWQIQWADSFFTTSTGFNQKVENFLFLLHEAVTQSPNDPRKNVEEKNKLIWSAREEILRSEWSLTTQVQFAPKSKGLVLECTAKIINLLEKALKEKLVDFEAIREALFSFNAASKAAHRELLGL